MEKTIDNLYYKELLISQVRDVELNDFARYTFRTLTGKTDEEKASILKKVSLDVIMAGYYHGLIKNVYHLLPEDYRDFNSLAFLACMCGDDISTRTAKLKNDKTLNDMLLYHCKDSIQFISKKALENDNKEALKFYVGEHVDSLNYVPKGLIDQKLIDVYFQSNAKKLANKPFEEVSLLLEDIPAALKKNIKVISTAAETNLAMLYSFHIQDILIYLRKSGKLQEYYNLLNNRINELHEKLSGFLAGNIQLYDSDTICSAYEYKYIMSDISVLSSAIYDNTTNQISSAQRKREIDQINKNKRNGS